MTGDREWVIRAACRSEDPTCFFPDDFSGHTRVRSTVAALRICSTCPVRDECLVDALRHERRGMNVFGIRGGMTPRARAELVESMWAAWLGARCSGCGRRLVGEVADEDSRTQARHYRGGVCIQCAASGVRPDGGFPEDDDDIDGDAVAAPYPLRSLA